MAIDPSATGAADDQQGRAEPGTGFRTSSRSKSVSQAVIAVSGTAAALRPSERAGLVADDPLVDEMEFSVRALTADRAGIENRVAGLEVVTSGPVSTTIPAAS